LAIYVPPSARRRRLVLLVLIGLVVGLVAGFAAGRATSSGVDDAVSRVRGEAQDAAVAFQRIPIEYQQAADDAGGESTSTITEAIARARAQLDSAWAHASWFGRGVRPPVDAKVDALAEVASAHGRPEEFQAAVDDAVAAIERAFGVTVAGSG
jgi:hypothetical protein